MLGVWGLLGRPLVSAMTALSACRAGTTAGVVQDGFVQGSTIVLHSNSPLWIAAMPTTTIRIEDELKERIASAAQLSGKTAHAFILDAIAQTVEQVEIDAEFDRVADDRWATLLQSGQTVAWDEARAYLEARGKGAEARKPAVRNAKR